MARRRRLIADRLDAGVADSGGNEIARLVSLADITYYVSNRTYSPRHGRWLQQDPNATGQPLLGGATAGRPLNSGQALCDIETMFRDGASRYGYLGSNAWTRQDATGLAWVENYSGVVLPLVTLADGFMRVSLLGPVMDLLNGYGRLLSTVSLVSDIIQESAFAQEEMMFDALEWSTSDDIFLNRTAYGRLTDRAIAAEQAAFDAMIMGPPVDTGGQAALASAGGRAQVGGGQWRHAERVARTQRNAVPVRRMINAAGLGRRLYDGEIGNVGSMRFMEVKSGNQGLTHRVRLQALKDGELLRDDQVKGILWVFKVQSGKRVSHELKQFLSDLGIQFVEEPF